MEMEETDDQQVNLSASFASFEELWSPRIAAVVDEYDVKLAKLEGEFHWHLHEGVDELFLVVSANGELNYEISMILNWNRRRG